MHVDRLRGHIECSPLPAARQQSKKNGAARGAAPGARTAMRLAFGCAPSVRAVQSTLPRRPFGRAARELVSSKSLPQEEPTVAWRSYCSVFLYRDDPLGTHLYGAFRTALHRLRSCANVLLSPFPRASTRDDALPGVSLPAPNHRAEARALALGVIPRKIPLPAALRLLSGVLRMANRSEAAFSPKQH